MIGRMGTAVIGVLICDRLGLVQERDILLAQLPELVNEACKSRHCDEMLYGRASSLYGLCFLEEHLSQAALDRVSWSQLKKKLVRRMIESSNLTTQQIRAKYNGQLPEGLPPLFYYWHDTAYLGK